MGIYTKNSLKGRVAIVKYDNTIVQLRFDTFGNMYWKMIKEGKELSGKERVSHKQLKEGLFSISWIEKGGICVNQLINLETKTLSAVWQNLYTNDTNYADGNIKIIA